MNDDRKFHIAIAISSILVVLCIANTIFQEHFANELFGYVKRRMYYSGTISPKGLTLHEGQYWRKSQ